MVKITAFSVSPEENVKHGKDTPLTTAPCRTSLTINQSYLTMGSSAVDDDPSKRQLVIDWVLSPGMLGEPVNGHGTLLTVKLATGATGAAACDTTTSCPPPLQLTRTEPLRAAEPVLPATCSETTPVPLPEAPELIVTKLELDDAVHAQPACVVTVVVTVPPFAMTLIVDGATLYVQEGTVVPAWLTSCAAVAPPEPVSDTRPARPWPPLASTT
jgi:hypothetical protein